MPRTVVVGQRSGDGVGESCPHPKDKLSVVLHVHVTVVAVATTSLSSSKADDLAAGARRRLEPGFFGVVLRIVDAAVAVRTAVCSIEANRGVRRTSDRASLT